MSQRPLRTNFIVNLLSPTVRIAVALVTIPIYLRHVGEARYGVISIVWVLLGFFGFLDLGLSRAVTNALAKLRDAPQPDRARILLTTMSLNCGMGLIGGLILYFVGGFLLEHFISLPDALRPEVSGSLPWIASVLPLTLISTAGIGALESRERFLLVNSIQIVGMTLSQVAPVIVAVLISPSLMIVIPSAVAAQALTAIAVLAVVYRQEGPFSLAAFDRREARTLLGYGSWMSVSNIIPTATASADQFIIGSVMGVVAVAHYSVPMNLVSRSGLIPTAFGRTFFPRMSNLPRDAARALGGRALSTMGYGFAAVCAPAIILSPIVFRFWIGADFALLAAPVAQILFLGMWMSGLSFVAFTLAQSQGRADLPAKLHLAELLPFLAILWGLTTAFGITGAAVAWSFRCTVDSLAMIWVAGMPKKSVISALAPAAALVASFVASKIIGPGVVVSLVAAVIAGAVCAALAYCYSEDWRRLIQGLFARGRRLLDGFGRVVSPKQSAKPTADS